MYTARTGTTGGLRGQSGGFVFQSRDAALCHFIFARFGALFDVAVASLILGRIRSITLLSVVRGESKYGVTWWVFETSWKHSNLTEILHSSPST